MKVKKVPPLDLLKKYTNKFPDIWEQIERYRMVKDKIRGVDWPDECYVPIADIATILEARSHFDSLEKIDNFSAVFDVAAIAALAPWRQFKEIYSFSPELQDALFSQVDEDVEIPTQILDSLPFPCVYIELNPSSFLDDLIPDLVGFFVHFEYNISDSRRELRFLSVDLDGHTCQYMLHLRDGYTLKDAINSAVDESLKNSDSLPSLERMIERVRVSWGRLVSMFLQLTLYICCQNAEIEEDPEQKRVYERKEGVVKDQYREIRKWNVGEAFSRKIKLYNDNNRHTHEGNDSSGQRNRPRPHARRGHWHHFWTGSKNSDARKLVLKWVSPTYVNSSNEDDIAGKIVEIHNDKK